MKPVMKKLLLASFLAIPALAAPWTVTPGRSVGPVQLGQSYQQANQVLTPESASGNRMLGYLNYKEGISLECRNQLITQIFIYNTRLTGKPGSVNLQLPGNLNIGCPASQVQSALGRPTDSHNLPVAKGRPVQTYYAYNRLGLGVRTEGGRVVEFSLWPPKP